MGLSRRRVWMPAVCAAVGLVAARGGPVCAQFDARLGPGVPSAQFELAPAVQLDLADSAVRAELERAKAQVAGGQWDDAIQTLREVMENSGSKLVGVTEHRFLSVRDYGHLQIVSLPPEALALYRGRVDAVAQKWYEEGVARRDRGPLLNVVEQAFASSWGDDALMALGEMALEAGEYASARHYWERIVPAAPPAEGPRTWLCYPDTRLDLAAVRARLVLASILEGSLARAREELTRFAELHPEAKGRFAGREVRFVDALREMLAEAPEWPARRPDAGWPTFAGSPARNKVAAPAPELGRVAWRVPLARGAAGQAPPGAESPLPGVAEDAHAPLCYHPVVSGGLVLVSTPWEIEAFELRTGKPAWGQGVIYRDQLDVSARGAARPPEALGVPRFTMTVHEGRLYARMGAAVTARPHESALSAPPGYLVCLDLEAEGRLVWKAVPEDKQWAFEGSPLADGAGVYVAMRRSEIGPQVQAHVACLDAETGRPRWRTFVCGAETRARGVLHETTHNLLTREGDTIYYSTNLGAVAAVSARDGRVRWVSSYPRVRKGNLLKPAPHWARDLTPCLYDRGTLLVAPADSPRIFALDAATGQVLWQTGPEVEDAVHLLGVAGDRLIAAGDKLYWINLSGERPGAVHRAWPDGAEKPGHGRGVLAGARVLWPTRDGVYVFDRDSGRQVRLVQLRPLGLGGGNLVAAGGGLIVAAEDSLAAIRPGEGEGPPEGDVVVTGRVPATLQPSGSGSSGSRSRKTSATARSVAPTCRILTNSATAEGRILTNSATENRETLHAAR